jgi:hypothetical protein
MARIDISKKAQFTSGTVILFAEVFYQTEKVTIKDKNDKDFRIQDAPKDLVPLYEAAIIEINAWVAIELP